MADLGDGEPGSVQRAARAGLDIPFDVEMSLDQQLAELSGLLGGDANAHGGARSTSPLTLPRSPTSGWRHVR